MTGCVRAMKGERRPPGRTPLALKGLRAAVSWEEQVRSPRGYMKMT